MGKKRTYQLDLDFEEAKKIDPNLTFGAFYGRSVVKKLKEGTIHPTLGGNLYEGRYWGSVCGSFDYHQRLIGTSPQRRVIDYGCGTLRVGVNWIRHLEPGGYFGLDIVPELLDIGRGLLGEEEYAEKQPKLGLVTDDDDLQAAVAHNADLIFSIGTVMHIPPEEMATVTQNIQAMAHKPGVYVFIAAEMSAGATTRLGGRYWSFPREFFENELFPDLVLTKVRERKKGTMAGESFTTCHFVYRRPEDA